MTKVPVARVTIELNKEPGGPKLSAEDVALWVEIHMGGDEVAGFNTCRYSDARVVALEILNDA